MSRFINARKDAFVASVKERLCIRNVDISDRCKFNFSFFIPEPKPAVNFPSLTQRELSQLLNHIKDFSRFSLLHWKNDGHYVEYGGYPSTSRFKCPGSVPADVNWSRFRLGGAQRLIGFTIPHEYRCEVETKAKMLYDCNTFYVVFYDRKHDFYPCSH